MGFYHDKSIEEQIVGVYKGHTECCGRSAPFDGGIARKTELAVCVSGNRPRWPRQIVLNNSDRTEASAKTDPVNIHGQR
jgi:hypothetical protein